jgi:broad specificity phosphatase PhoE
MSPTDSAASRVWLARHGNRQDFADPLWRQFAALPDDPDLSDDGRLQAQELAARLQGEPIAHIVASPFLRTVRTANAVAEALDLPIKIESGIAEWLNREWFGGDPKRRQFEELCAEFPRIDRTYRSVIEPHFPEDWAVFQSRCRLAAEALTAEFDGELLMVMHGASVIAVAQALLNKGTDIGWSCCGITRLQRKGAVWKLDLNNDTRHLTHRNDPKRLA